MTEKKTIHLGKPEDMVIDRWFAKILEEKFSREKIKEMFNLIHEIGHSTYITENTNRDNIYSLIIQELFERKIKIIDLLLLSVDLIGSVSLYHNKEVKETLDPILKVIDDLIKKFGDDRNE